MAKHRHTIAIVGAGVAGLTAGIRLQKMGFDVSIYEKNPQVGGRLNQIREAGFSFDLGPTIILMPEIYEEIFTFSGVDPKAYIPMTLLDPLYQLHFNDGTSLSISSNLTTLIKTLEGFSREDTEGYLKYIADVYGRYTVARRAFIERSFTNIWDVLKPSNIWDTLKLRTLNSAYHSISSFVKNEKLRQALSFQTLYIGVSPFTGPSIYTIIPMIELLYGVWYIRGGLYAMAQALERRFKELGGHIHLRANVEKIIIEDRVAKGIQVNGQKQLADIVLCNADFPFAVDALIEGESNRKPFSSARLKRMQYSSSSLTVYLGMKKKYPTTVHQIRYGDDFQKNISDLDAGNIPENPSFYIYSPSQIDETVAPKGQELFYVLIPVPNLQKNPEIWTPQFTESYIDQVLTRISKIPGFSDFKQHIAFKKWFTPVDFKNSFNLYEGATFGLKPILTQSNFFRPQAKALKIKNLYFAGSSTHPGAGIPIVMMSGKIAAEQIKKDHLT